MPDATKNSGFLERLLKEAAARAKGQPVVVLVDALDEAEAPMSAAENRLLLPPSLPEGVFFVVTTREKEDYQLSADRLEPLYLEDDDPRNLEDISRYIRNFLSKHRHQMAQQIAAWQVSEEEFVEVMTGKSQGNFMYLVYVLADIREGKLTTENVDDIRNLPLGLREYYQRHWRIMREQYPERFERVYEPVVCTLAVVREPVTIANLVAWTARFTAVPLTPMRIKEVIREWRQFLNEDLSSRGEPLYRVYHTSFQDFLRDEVGLTPYHDAIAQTALDKIPGFASRPDGR
jgi:hypothetical protein